MIMCHSALMSSYYRSLKYTDLPFRVLYIVYADVEVLLIFFPDHQYVSANPIRVNISIVSQPMI